MNGQIRTLVAALALLIGSAAPAAAHGFHGAAPALLAHVAVHALPIALCGGAALLLAGFEPAARLLGGRSLRAAGAALLVFGAVLALV